MAIELRVTTSPAAKSPKIRLQAGDSLTLGRESEADYSFSEDGRMSSVHARITATEQGVSFQDLRSTNGTFLNGRKASSGQAVAGDELQLGNTVFVVVVNQDNEVTPSRDCLQRPRETNVKVLVLEGPDGATREVLPGQPLSIGRTDKSKWAFQNDDQLSGLHFVIHADGDFWEVVDMESANGTFLNNRRIERAVIDDGDQILAGRNVFHVHVQNLRMEQPTRSFTMPGEGSDDDNHQVAPEPRKPLRNDRGRRPAESGHRTLRICPRNPRFPSITIEPGTSSVVGRTSDSDIVIPDDRVSSRHLQIKWFEDLAEFHDLGSTNGTFLNDKRVSSGIVRDGDVLTIGSTILDVEYGEESPSRQNFVESSAKLSEREPIPDRETTQVDGVRVRSTENEMTSSAYHYGEPAKDEATPARTEGSKAVCDFTDVTSKSDSVATDKTVEMDTGPLTAEEEPKQSPIPNSPIYCLRGSILNCDLLIENFIKLIENMPGWLLHVEDGLIDMPGNATDFIRLDKLSPVDAAWMVSLEEKWGKDCLLVLFTDQDERAIRIGLEALHSNRSDYLNHLRPSKLAERLDAVEQVPLEASLLFCEGGASNTWIAMVSRSAQQQFVAEFKMLFCLAP